MVLVYPATLPHEKFYHMEAYEQRMNALRSGEYIPPADDGYDPTADMRDLQSKHKRTAVEHESYLNKDQLQALRKVQQERIEVSHPNRLGQPCSLSLFSLPVRHFFRAAYDFRC